ncbi:TraB/GumN family protein [Candidatus Woesearchaeota archaeon]|nr:MAG: TraB family protein [archaeon GW2011_AR4]MBS3129200.1 TraB/GumN family protein [Candidatus Woesearchaeota archaeon]HIH39041.1 hypothetical protein [Candidatus Woesearchaeota archaeon]HIH48348.1 hypothetical protein [Candidatus Woesearchaeota archaeon]HIJ04060.1 hypothetical protein [Candidatus Woesearchaeota archaeon]
MAEIFILGTSHIARQSVKEVKEAIEKINPGIIAIELDPRRLAALLSKKREKTRISDVGVKAYLILSIAQWAQKKLGSSVGISPGTEMLTAYKQGKAKNKKIALIDQDIQITLNHLTKAVSFRDVWQMLKDLFRGLILRKPVIEFDLSTVPDKEVIKKILELVKKDYPRIYHALVTERDKVMARNLRAIANENPEEKILAIVGAGHEEGLKKLLSEPQTSFSFHVE